MSQMDPGSQSPIIPVPVQALPYSGPMQYGRPGLITAIGVMSIVIACLSGFGSLVTGMYGFGFWMMSKMSASMTAPSATVSVTSSSTNVGMHLSTKQSLTVGDAAVAVNELTKALSLDAARVRELDQLMRSHGREVLGGEEDDSVSAASVRGSVTEQGRGEDGSIYFVTPQGRVDLYTNRAAFVSADGSIRITTSARKRFDSVQSSSTSTVGGPASTTLTADQVNQIVNSVIALSPASLNPKQLQALRAELSKPNQELVTPGPRPAATFVNNMGGRASASIGFDTGNVLVLDPQGQVTVSGPSPLPAMGISGATAGMVIGEAAGSVALAIYLLVVGILVFRSSPGVPRLLRIYAFLKIPLAALAGVGLSMMGYEFATGIITRGGVAGGPTTFAFVVWGIAIAVLGCAFPIGLLIALHTRTVKEYFGAVAR